MIFIYSQKYYFLLNSFQHLKHNPEMVVARPSKEISPYDYRNYRLFMRSLPSITRESLTPRFDLMLNLVVSRKSPTGSPT